MENFVVFGTPQCQMMLNSVPKESGLIHSLVWTKCGPWIVLHFSSVNCGQIWAQICTYDTPSKGKFQLQHIGDCCNSMFGHALGTLATLPYPAAPMSVIKYLVAPTAGSCLAHCWYAMCSIYFVHCSVHCALYRAMAAGLCLAHCWYAMCTIYNVQCALYRASGLCLAHCCILWITHTVEYVCSYECDQVFGCTRCQTMFRTQRTPQCNYIELLAPGLCLAHCRISWITHTIHITEEYVGSYGCDQVFGRTMQTLPDHV